MRVKTVFLCWIGLWPAASLADPIALFFPPPEVPRQDLCVPARGLDDVKETWATEGWPAGLATSVIRRDITILRKDDAAVHLPMIRRILSGLAALDPNFAEKHAVLAEIQALQAAGAVQEIRERQLVQELATLSSGSSAQVSWALARFYEEGLGVAPDAGIADRYLVAAAELGHPEALLTLAARQLDKRAPNGWEAPAEASIRQAFATLLTPLNAGVCDRTARIARAYFKGTLVQKNVELGQAWLRFAADLGDAQAAWKIYELHRLGEEVASDTAVRLSYLRQAAEAGLPFAQIALGRVHERGALVTQDLDKALGLYRQAAATGSRAGLIRLALFLEEYQREYKEAISEKVNSLQDLSELSDTPAWVYTRLANELLRIDPTPEQRAAAKDLYHQAAALGDREAKMRLAEILLSDRSAPQNFGAAVDLLSEAVALHGSAGAAKKLFDAHMCQAPDAPRLQEARFWQAQYEAADPALPDVADKDAGPARLAALQSQALYQRRSALATWVDHLKTHSGAAAVLAFWDGYTEGRVQAQQALDALADWEATAQWRQDAATVLEAEYDAKGAAAMAALERAFVQDAGVHDAALVAHIRQGSGAAMRLLAVARGVPLEELIPAYKAALLQRGDFHALLMVAPFAEAPKRVLERAIGKMPCDFKSAMSVAQAVGRVGDVARLTQFLQIAQQLHKDKPWAMTHLGDAILRWNGLARAAEAAALFEEAFAAGEVTAGKRLLELAQTPETPLYDPERAQRLKERLAEAS